VNNELFKNGIEVIKTLKAQGFEAFFVGGCVRDYLLDVKFNDIDIASNARTFEVRNLFENTQLIGEKYGTIQVIVNNEKIQITTYRQESNYSDSRHPSNVNFDTGYAKDVQRRDFTINGLLMDENLSIIDLVGGKDDLQKKVIKTIGPANERFKEDALRMLRAFYFVSKLDFYVENETFSAINHLASTLNNISKERILQELIKIIKAPHYKKALSLLAKSNIRFFLSGLTKGIEYLGNLFSNENPAYDMRVDTFFTLCFCLNGSVDNYYNFSNRSLHQYQEALIIAKEKSYLNPHILFHYGIEIPKLASWANYILKVDELRIKEISQAFLNLPIKSIYDVAINGNTILEVTQKKMGSWVGKILNQIIDLILDHQLKNEKETLIKYLKEQVGN
jgi:tRNA nucleotidyltransferase (CCA-adding enzyme)